ncbi:MAG: radical SAM protein [Paracoccaceae bacterium]
MNSHLRAYAPEIGKFEHRRLTAMGEPRASVALGVLETLWFNTGTVCNIECVNCYIESSPKNDALAYLKPGDVRDFLDQAAEFAHPVREVGFTGGEPFMNPDMIELTEIALARGHEVLILTNAMRPMMRTRIREGLRRLNSDYPGKMTLRVSLDHHMPAKNDEIRGRGSFDIALAGLRWLRDHDFSIAVAGRTLWGEDEAGTRAGFGKLFRDLGVVLDAANPRDLVLFPEMNAAADVPEITPACWDILKKTPSDVMCANTRMVVRRRNAEHPVVVACTLLPHEAEFELGNTLAKAGGEVFLNHPHCAKFCVLGGAACS